MNNNTPAQEMTGKQRCDTLAEISGLVVTSRVEKGQRIFTFALPYDSQCHVKETFTYPKAKLFAEGVRLGRELEAAEQ